jgi:hypothetical protein
MPAGHINFNSQGYILSPIDENNQRLIRRSRREPFVQAISESGLQVPSRLGSYNSVVFPNFINGFGRNRINSDHSNPETHPDDYRGFWDSTLETRFSHDVRLPLLSVSAGNEPATARVVASQEFLGKLYTLWSEVNVDGTQQDIHIREWQGASNSWTGTTSIKTEDANSDGLRAFDLVAHTDSLLALVNVVDSSITPSGAFFVYRSTDAASWTLSAKIGGDNELLPASRRGNTYPLDGGLLSPQQIHGESVCAIWDEANSQIEIYSSTNNFAARTTELAFTSINGPQGIAILPSMDSEDKLYLGTAEGLYEIDCSPSTWTKALIFPMPAHTDNCRRMATHQGSLYFGQGVGNDSPAPIYKLTITESARIFEEVGLDQGDGIPNELMGSVRWFESNSGFLYMSVSGGNNETYARVLAHNGHGWHSVTKVATANRMIKWMGISTLNDAVPRLHYSEHESGTDSTNYIRYHAAHPTSSVNIGRAASGYIKTPFVDGGFPGHQKVWLRHRVHGLDFDSSTSGEYVTIKHGINANQGSGVARTATTAGNIFSTVGHLDINSGVGTAGVSLGAELTLNRNGDDAYPNNIDSPKIRDYEINYWVKVAPPQAWEFIIDIQRTAQLLDKSPEEVITDLETVRDSVVLVPFSYANMTSTNVRLSDIEFIETWANQGGGVSEMAPHSDAVRIGQARVVVEEIFG